MLRENELGIRLVRVSQLWAVTRPLSVSLLWTADGRAGRCVAHGRIRCCVAHYFEVCPLLNCSAAGGDRVKLGKQCCYMELVAREQENPHWGPVNTLSACVPDIMDAVAASQCT